MIHLSDNIMEILTPIFEIMILCLNFLSIIVLVWGVIISGYDFIRSESTHIDHVRAARNNNFIKNFLGSYILLSLEILIAADIIESIINPTTEDILRLAAVVVIRTVISFFLHRELQDALDDEEENKIKKIKR
ncbi:MULTISPECIES: DUF1622 domain-containing protein [Enterococcus]|uniref:DUF1622 domain-containing protein n=1 Tax=Enterococcus TaxID=1350 RepID=UPI00065DDB39|nr:MULTISPECIES: DUF1622 domain-containing protein [Enterococcus]KAF1302503.1 hypothetical protein BAU16_06705 [Enterococcus sp. JM9B]